MTNSLPFSLVIWDWNGTLVNDAGASWESVNDMLARRELPPITFQQYSSYIETPITGFYRHIFEDFDSMDFGQIAREFHEGTALHMVGRGLMPGAGAVLERLREAGVKQVIVSSCEQGMLTGQVTRYGVAEYFDAILGAGDFHAGSKIDRARDYMARCGISPDRTVNIGDMLECKVAEIDGQGRINLIRNDIVYDNEAMPVRRPPRTGDRRPGNDRGGRR